MSKDLCQGEDEGGNGETMQNSNGLNGSANKPIVRNQELK